MYTTSEEQIVPTNEEAIKVFERHFGFALPFSYRSFLLKHNGGSPDKNVFAYDDDYGDNNSTVRKFLSLGGGSDSLEHYLEVYSGRIPPNALPIAYDDGGNLICLLFDGKSQPVAFWDHEMEGENAEDAVFYLIAPNFEEFCQSLF